MSIGFIVVSNKLKKEENNNEKYEVKINKVIKNNVIKGSQKDIASDYKIIDNNKTIDITMNLKDNNDSISYTAIIKNTAAEFIYRTTRRHPMIIPIIMSKND